MSGTLSGRWTPPAWRASSASCGGYPRRCACVAPPLERLGLLAGIRHGERDDLARARQPELLITTPESLDVLLMSRSPGLASVRAVVLDEIHLTYNTQRGFQTAVLLCRLERQL